jgi:WD40 repeat protein
LFAVYGEEEGRRGEGETVALWDLRSRQVAQRFPSPVNGHDSRSKTGMCMCLRLFAGASGSPCLASLWENGHLYLWDSRKPSTPFAATATGGATETKRMHDEPPLAFDLAVVNGGRSVRGVSGGADAHIGIFSAELEPELDEIVAGEGAAEPVAQGYSGQTTPGLVQVEQRLEVGHAGVGAVAIRPDQKIFATGGWDKRVRVWDFKRARPLAILKAHAGAVNCLAFSNTDNLLVSGSADTRIACWALY